MNDQQEQQHADETALQRDVLETLNTAMKRPLTRDEAMLLAWGSGVASDFYKETQ